MEKIKAICIWCLLWTAPLMSQTNWINIGDNNLVQGQYLLALDAFTNHIDEYPDEYLGYVKRAYVHTMLGEEELAKRDIKSARKAYILEQSYAAEQSSNSIINTAIEFEILYPLIWNQRLSVINDLRDVQP